MNETDRQIDAIIHCGVPWLLQFAIEAPDGQIFGPPQTASPGAHYVVGKGSAYYRLDIPSFIVGPQDPARPWFARVGIDGKRWKEYLDKLRRKDGPAGQSGPSSAVHGLRYAFTTQARSSLRMDVSVTQSSREPGAVGWLRASLLEYGYPLQNAAKVWAVISDPKGAVTQLALAPAGNATYQASLVANLTGAWRVTIHADGKTTRGNRPSRGIRSVAVWPGGDRPGPRTPPKTPATACSSVCAKAASSTRNWLASWARPEAPVRMSQDGKVSVK